uniref:Ig-like domain-containing protein n=1 Tax=Esox lucius TaxID=8010 RepID=A0AAY5JVV3_ESOLU
DGPLYDQVHQSPADLFSKQRESAKIECSHSIPGYNTILWYKQDGQRKLILLGYMLATSKYPELVVNITLDGDANQGGTSTLTIKQTTPNSSAVYFCAASYTVDQISLSALQKPPPRDAVGVLTPASKSLCN